MAKIGDLDLVAWETWVASRPPAVQALCRRLPPDRLYAMAPTGQRVTIVSYAEDGTVRVVISAEYNFVMFEREVFGISPDSLSECDIPSDDEPVGAMLTEESDIHKFCDAVRADQRSRH